MINEVKNTKLALEVLGIPKKISELEENTRVIIQTRGSSVDTSQFVPYLGATTTVDLGANNLLAKQVGIDSTPDRPLTIDTANSAVPAGEGSVMIYGGVNKERVEIRSAGGEPAFQSKRAGGTWAVPTKSTLGTRLFSLGASGHDGTDWVAGAKGIIALYAAEAWEAGKNGTYFSVGLTPIGSSKRGDVFRIQNDGKVGIKTTAPDRMLEINTGAATDGIRISYNDGNGSATTYGDILLDSSGYMTISPTGNSLTIDADVDLGSEDLTTTGAITGLSGNFTALYVNTDDFYVDGGKIGIGTDTPATKIDIWSTAVEEKASLGSQWLTGGTWTVPTGWTDNGDGTFTHAGSATDALVYSKNPSNGTYYYVPWAVSGRTTGTISISMGGQETSGHTVSSYFGLKASDSVNKLTITPINSFDGTISISAFVMTPYSALETITDSWGVVISERRSTDSSASQFIGTNCGRYTYNAYNNNGYGKDTFASLTTGHDNNAFGKSALPNLTYGVYNNAIGSTSLYTLTYGACNVSIGHQAQYYNKIGSHNIGIGYAALQKVTGSYNVGIGSLALGTTTGSYNIGLGFSAGRYAKGNYEFYVNHKDQGDTATEKANSLMFGVMGAAAKDQTLAFNVASLTINGGVDTDITVNFTGTTNSGVLKWMEDEDHFESSDDVLVQADLCSQTYNYGADAGSSDAYAITLDPAVTLTVGQMIIFKANTSNTGACTLSINGGGYHAIKKHGGTVDLDDAEIRAGEMCIVVYDGTNFQLINALAPSA